MSVSSPSSRVLAVIVGVPTLLYAVLFLLVFSGLWAEYGKDAQAGPALLTMAAGGLVLPVLVLILSIWVLVSATKNKWLLGGASALNVVHFMGVAFFVFYSLRPLEMRLLLLGLLFMLVVALNCAISYVTWTNQGSEVNS